MENFINFNFVNAYFGICIVVWLLNVIATLAIIMIKPLRKWIISVCYHWGKTYGEELCDVMEDDINEIVSSLDEMFVKKEEKEQQKDEDLFAFEENEDESL